MLDLFDLISDDMCIMDGTDNVTIAQIDPVAGTDIVTFSPVLRLRRVITADVVVNENGGEVPKATCTMHVRASDMKGVTPKYRDIVRDDMGEWEIQRYEVQTHATRFKLFCVKR